MLRIYPRLTFKPLDLWTHRCPSHAAAMEGAARHILAGTPTLLQTPSRWDEACSALWAPALSLTPMAHSSGLRRPDAIILKVILPRMIIQLNAGLSKPYIAEIRSASLFRA